MKFCLLPLLNNRYKFGTSLGDITVYNFTISLGHTRNYHHFQMKEFSTQINKLVWAKGDMIWLLIDSL